LLKDLTSEKLIRLNIHARDWQDAIRQAAQPLVDHNKISISYVEDIIAGVIENGPYIVITKHVALPHARAEAGAKENAIGIATLSQPVAFGNEANDPVKYLFCLSATDNSRHLSALAELANLFEDKEFFKLLDTTKNKKDIIQYIKDKEEQ
jgi:PTS system ascorbate-specific IIA component